MNAVTYPTEVQPGDLLLGKFRVERVLGRGGMGVVVAARHLTLDERVAIKFLLPDGLGNATVVERFLREARAAVRIRSEHVARVIDVGTMSDGAPFIVMEYLEGQDLKDVLLSARQLPERDAVDYVLQASEALAEAHALGIVHRDLKPANLFRTQRPDGSPCVKVLDFGISKTSDLHALTQTSGMLGSPLYMSPEQLQNAKDVDARSDVWSLGTVLYELLAGSPPFVSDQLATLVVSILQHPAPPLRSWRPDVHPGLEAAIVRCLEKDRTRRMASVAELAAAIAPFGGEQARFSADRIARILSSSSSSSSSPGVAPSPTPLVATLAEPNTMQGFGGTMRSSPPPARRSRALLALVVLVPLVAIGSVAAFVKTRETRETRTPSAPATTSTPSTTVSAPVPPAPSVVAPSSTPSVSIAPSSAPSVAPKPIAAPKPPKPTPSADDPFGTHVF